MVISAKINEVISKTNNVLGKITEYKLKPNNVLPSSTNVTNVKTYRTALETYYKILKLLKDRKTLNIGNRNKAIKIIENVYGINNLKQIIRNAQSKIKKEVSDENNKNVIDDKFVKLAIDKLQTGNNQNLLKKWLENVDIRTNNTKIRVKKILSDVLNVPEIVLVFNMTSNNEINKKMKNYDISNANKSNFTIKYFPKGSSNIDTLTEGIYLPDESDIFMYGRSGSGKTTIMSQLYRKLSNNKKNMSTNNLTIYYPEFNIEYPISSNSRQFNITIEEKVDNVSYNTFQKNHVRYTPFNPQSSRAHSILYVGNRRFVDLCGNEDPILLSKAYFNNHNIFKYMIKPISHLSTVSKKGRLQNKLNEFIRLMPTKIKDRKTRIINEKINQIKVEAKSESAKNTNDTVSKVINILEPSSAFELYIIANIVYIIMGNDDLKDFFIDGKIKDSYEIIKRCFESIYISRTLSELKTVFNRKDYDNVSKISNEIGIYNYINNKSSPGNVYKFSVNHKSLQNNKGTYKMIKSKKSTLFSEVFRENNTRKIVMFAVVNPKGTSSNNANRMTLKNIRKFKSLRG